MHVIKFLQKYMVGFVFISGVIVMSGVGVIYFQVKDELPQIPKNLRYLNQQPPTVIYSRDGKVLKILGDRSYMTLDLISPIFRKPSSLLKIPRFMNITDWTRLQFYGHFIKTR